jgi:hypothetical protein
VLKHVSLAPPGRRPRWSGRAIRKSTLSLAQPAAERPRPGRRPDLTSIKLGDYRRTCAAPGQFLRRHIAENIAYARPHASRGDQGGQLHRALRRVHRRVRAGYDTIVGERACLGGQRQRVAIARDSRRSEDPDPDEATSSLTAKQAMIQTAGRRGADAPRSSSRTGCRRSERRSILVLDTADRRERDARGAARPGGRYQLYDKHTA